MHETATAELELPEADYLYGRYAHTGKVHSVGPFKLGFYPVVLRSERVHDVISLSDGDPLAKELIKNGAGADIEWCRETIDPDLHHGVRKFRCSGVVEIGGEKVGFYSEEYAFPWDTVVPIFSYSFCRVKERARDEYE